MSLSYFLLIAVSYYKEVFSMEWPGRGFEPGITVQQPVALSHFMEHFLCQCFGQINVLYSLESSFGNS
jgi:hypothetical protein